MTTNELTFKTLAEEHRLSQKGIKIATEWIDKYAEAEKKNIHTTQEKFFTTKTPLTSLLDLLLELDKVAQTIKKWEEIHKIQPLGLSDKQELLKTLTRFQELRYLLSNLSQNLHTERAREWFAQIEKNPSVQIETILADEGKIVDSINKLIAQEYKTDETVDNIIWPKKK